MIGTNPLINTTPPTKGHFHAVRFYESDESIGHIVAAFLGTGLVCEEPALVIATTERRAVVRRHLRGANFCVAVLLRADAGRSESRAAGDLQEGAAIHTELKAES